MARVSYRPGVAGLPPGLQEAVNDLAQRVTQLERARSGSASVRVIEGLQAAQVEAGILVTAKVTDGSALASAALLRGTARDPALAQAVQTWADPATGQTLSWTDPNPGTAGATVFYWLRLTGTDGSAATLGPAAETIPGAVSAAFIAAFTATQVPAGIEIAFTLAAAVGLAGISLDRAATNNQNAAVSIWSVAAPRQGDEYSFLDTSAPAGQTSYYWLHLTPGAATANPVFVGPQSAPMPAVPAAGNALEMLSVSESAGPSGSEAIGIAYLAPATMPGCKVYAAGYQGVAGNVAVAESAYSPFSFNLLATGEAVTLKCVPVDANGNEGAMANALTAHVTLDGAPSAPAVVMPVAAAALYDGIQVRFPAGPESGITSYSVSRGPRGGGFGAAALVGSVTPTAGVMAYTYEDTTGTAAHEWYVQAVSANGTGAASAAAQLTDAALDFANRIGLNQAVHQAFSTPVAANTVITQPAGSAFGTCYLSAQKLGVPGTLDLDVLIAGGILDVFLDCGNSTAFLFRFDGRAANTHGILKIAVANGAWAQIGSQLLAPNAAPLAGWHHMRLTVLAMGQMDLYVDGQHAATAQDQSLAPNGNIYLGWETVANPTVGPFTGSTSLGLITDVPGRQAFPTQTAVQRIKAVACGFSSTTEDASCAVNGVVQEIAGVAAGRSYNLAVVDRATMTVTYTATYDVYTSAANALALANELNGLDATKIVVIWTDDEPQRNRTTNGLPAAIGRCGGSAVFSSAQFRFRAAYLLIGIPGIGVGNGIELYAGAIDGDPNARVETTVMLTDGELHGLNGTLTNALTLAQVPGDPVTGASLSFRFQLPAAEASWYNVGTWNGGDGHQLQMVFNFGDAYDGSARQQAIETVICRQANANTGGGGFAPNISGATAYSVGSTYAQVKFVANPTSNPAGSGNEWDVYVNLPGFSSGHVTVDCALGDSFTWNPAAVADPGANSATVVAATGNLLADVNMDLNGSLNVTNQQLEAILLSIMADRVSGALAQNGSGDPYAFTVGDPAGAHLQSGPNPGQITVYNDAGAPVTAQVKRSVAMQQFSATNGATADDGEEVFFDQLNGTPYCLDELGNIIGPFDQTPFVLLHAINPPSGLGQLFASGITTTGFVVNSKTNATTTTTQNIAIGEMNALDASPPANATGAGDAYWSGTETDNIEGVSVAVSVATTRDGQAIGGVFRANQRGTYSGIARLCTGTPASFTVVNEGSWSVSWQSDGGTYSGGCSINGSVPAGTEAVVDVSWTAGTKQTDGNTPSASCTLTLGGSATSVNGVDFVGEAVEAWA